MKGVDVPLDQMPVFCRPGTEIPVYEKEVRSTDDIDFNDVTTITIG